MDMYRNFDVKESVKTKFPAILGVAGTLGCSKSNPLDCPKSNLNPLPCGTVSNCLWVEALHLGS